MNDYPSIWGSGQLLSFSGMSGTTDYLHGLCLQTGESGYCFELKNIDMNKEADGIIRFVGKQPDSVELTGEFFCFHEGEYCSQGVLPDAYHVLLQGHFEIRLNDELEMVQRGDKTLIARRNRLRPELLDLDIADKRDELGRELRTMPLPAGLSESGRHTAVKAMSQLKTQICTPEGHIRHIWSTPDRWPHRKMWLWDSVFHALGMRHFHPDLARQMIDAVFDWQREDGFIPLCGNPVDSAPMTQPPVLGLAMTLIHESEAAPQWIAEQAPKLARFVEWIMANRDSDGAGLVEWYVTGDPLCRSGESGMDNSPRFDRAVQLDATDFNSFLAFECEALANFLPDRRDYWLSHYHRLCGLINSRLWNDDLHFYLDYDVQKGEHQRIMASSGFLPLYCGAATEEQARHLVDHLHNPQTFGTPLRIPSIARCHEQEYSKDMWRGPVWVNINYLVALGLQRYHYDSEAHDLIRETLDEEEAWYLKRGTFFEFYDDRKECPPYLMDRKGKATSGEPDALHHPFRDYGWSGTLYLEMIHHQAWR